MGARPVSADGRPGMVNTVLPDTPDPNEWRLLGSFEPDPPPERLGKDRLGRRFVRETPEPPTDPPGALDQGLRISVFPNMQARVVEPYWMNLRNFARLLRDTRAPTREQLPCPPPHG
jgi:hypothetical protein